MKKLYKSSNDTMISGVCGGIAEYFNIDSTIVRLLTVGVAFFSAFTLVLVYIAAAVIMPRKDRYDDDIIDLD